MSIKAFGVFEFNNKNFKLLEHVKISFFIIESAINNDFGICLEKKVLLH